MRFFLAVLFATATLAADHDHDGLSDSLEQKLLERFRPHFMVSTGECDVLPAEFAEGDAPTVKARNGTLYGHAFAHETGAIELHWFHLWANDCGRRSHPLDVEHVSALVQKVKGDWKARFWFAAAHQDTLCDAAHGARAEHLDAVNRGARVWISQGKHASFLSLEACARGCGGDRCDSGRALPEKKIINLGEKDHPLHGAGWIHSRHWEFTSKLHTDFPAPSLARMVNADGVTSVGSGLRPVQAVVAGANNALDHTGNAFTTAGEQTEGSLALSAEKVGQSLKTAKDKAARWIRGRTR
mgnify:CR=1 FL=1